LKELPQKDVEKYWKEKEQEIGAEIKGKDMSEYIGGYQGIKDRTWGLLYYTESSFYFQTFPKKNWFNSFIGGRQTEDSGKTINFRILWEEVKEINLPPNRNALLTIFSPPDYRVYISYQIGSQENKLVLMMYSRKNRDRFIDCYHQCKNKK
jgi:hypothetical protein